MLDVSEVELLHDLASILHHRTTALTACPFLGGMLLYCNKSLPRRSAKGSARCWAHQRCSSPKTEISRSSPPRSITWVRVRRCGDSDVVTSGTPKWDEFCTDCCCFILDKECGDTRHCSKHQTRGISRRTPPPSPLRYLYRQPERTYGV